MHQFLREISHMPQRSSCSQRAPPLSYDLVPVQSLFSSGHIHSMSTWTFGVPFILEYFLLVYMVCTLVFCMVVCLIFKAPKFPFFSWLFLSLHSMCFLLGHLIPHMAVMNPYILVNIQFKSLVQNSSWNPRSLYNFMLSVPYWKFITFLKHTCSSCTHSPVQSPHVQYSGELFHLFRTLHWHLGVQEIKPGSCLLITSFLCINIFQPCWFFLLNFPVSLKCAYFFLFSHLSPYYLFTGDYYFKTWPLYCFWLLSHPHVSPTNKKAVWIVIL